MKRLLTYTLPLIAIALLIACEPTDTCRQDLLARMTVTLSADSLDEWLNTHHYTSWDLLSVRGADMDSMIVNHRTNVSSFTAELQPNDSLTAYLLTYHEQTDTLYVIHTPRMQFVSLACGCTVYHTLLWAWSSDERVDSVVIINASVENQLQENLRIYLHE